MKNIYTHEIDLQKLSIKNMAKKQFADELVKIPYRGYEVEDIVDGRKIVITKPGGKSNYGRPLKEDFLVFIYDPKQKTLWQISHKQIYDDLVAKSNADTAETIKILTALELVYNGEEPDDVLDKIKPTNPIGELPEVILKAYKWIWGQEDVNYPNGEGRAMSFNGIKELKEDLE